MGVKFTDISKKSQKQGCQEVTQQILLHRAGLTVLCVTHPSKSPGLHTFPREPNPVPHQFPGTSAVNYVLLCSEKI